MILLEELWSLQKIFDSKIMKRQEGISSRMRTDRSSDRH